MYLCQNRQESAFTVGMSLSMLDAAILGNETNYIRGIYKALERSNKIECSPLAENSFQSKIYDSIRQRKGKVSHP